MARKRRKRKSQRKKLRIPPKIFLWTGIGIGILATIIVIGRAVYKSDAFLITRVVVDEPLDKRVERELLGRSLFRIPLQEIQRDLMEEYPELKAIRIVKQFPSTVSIQVRPRKPVAQWKTTRYYLMGREGVVLDSGRDEPYSEYVVIETNGYRGRISKGMQIDDRALQGALSLAEIIQSSSFLREYTVRTINASQLPALSFSLGGINVMVGEGDWRKKIALLQTLLEEKIRENLSAVKYIDLRYQKVYVGYKR
ncbi:MAG: FtsQ-type POTRA domain-containing protein [Candidatus Omnitrophica bacterium]|nr:FtsQ-type POTRA domain-containing protein [Candidatus Omnitrophota bacterium]